MVADGDKCFRVSGIPDDYTESQIRALLVGELHLDDDVLIKIFSLARNPLRPDEWIATVSLSRIPTQLSERGQQNIDIPPTSPESRNPRRKVVLDSHFEGFTPLHTVKDDECCMDIVALSGLNGHAFGSFKAKGESHMWLRDALPLDLQKARIFIYGYDTSPDSVSFQNIWDLESTFRHRLRMLRTRSNSTRKPLIIVAHSLGGIIAKAAIIKMAEGTIDGDDSAYRSLRGILLFGVPSQGMDIESLIPMVPVSEMRALLSSLDKNNSPTLRELGENFPKKITKLQDFEVFNFYETRESPTARKNDKGDWEMKGPPTVLVTPFSATQGRLGNEPRHRVIAINRTHSEMIKFSGASDNDYEITLDCLKEIEKRVTYERTGWPLHLLSRDEQNCLRSLSFLEQHSREFDPKINPAEGTCTWIFEHKNYRSWLTTHSGHLWIMGPPGAGKSTLMKFMVKAERENQSGSEIIAAFFVHGRGSKEQKSHLGVYQSLLHQILPHCRGPLISLTKIHHDRTITRGGCGSKWSWEEEELREFFISTVITESCQRPITVFIDALDEMGEDSAAKLIANLQQLHSKALPHRSRVRLCFSCRYYPNLATEGDLSIAVEEENSRDINSHIETHTALIKLGLSDRETITKLIIERANGIFQWVSLILDEVKRLRRRGQPATAVIARIKEVPGTLKGIYDALLVFENEHDREQTLKLFQWILFLPKPVFLEDLRQALAIDANTPHDTLEEITQSDHYYQSEDMTAVVQDLSKGLVRVTKTFYRYADVGCVETIHQSVNDYLLQSGMKDLAQSLTEDPDFLARLQISRSCIKMLHQFTLLSASFLESEDECSDEHEELMEDEHEELMEDEHEELMEDEHEELMGDEREEFMGEYRENILDSMTDGLPLAAYAKTQWLDHIIKLERYEIDQQDLLELLPWQKDCGTLPIIFTQGWTMGCGFEDEYTEVNPVAKDFVKILCGEKSYHWDPVHLLALAGIHSALDRMEQVEPGIYSRMDPRGQTTLSFAIAGGNEKIVASAMGISAHHDVCNASFVMSPLHLAVLHGREDWVRAIISKGADLDQLSGDNLDTEKDACSALYFAWRRKDEGMVKQLLSAGADPSVLCSDGSQRTTVIHTAIKKADEWSKSMLPLLLESAIKLYPAKKLPNVMDFYDERSTLSYAIEQEDALLVQLLLDSGALQDHVGHSQIRDDVVLYYAAERGLEKMMKILLQSGINPSGDAFDKSPLHLAAANGHSSVVRLLLDAGAHPTGLHLDNEDDHPFLVVFESWPTDEASNTSISSGSIRNDDRTPLEMAVNNGYASVVQVFLDVADTPEADTKAKAKEIQTLPWDWYVQLAVQNNFPDVVQVLLKSGIDPNTFAFSEKPLLHIATGRGFVQLAQMLLRSGADPTLTDVSGVTALQIAIGNNHLETISVLLAWRDPQGRTLIMLEVSTSEQNAWLPLSARRDRPSWAIQQVLQTEYNFNVQDNKGLTALSYAVIENMPEIVDALLDHGRSDPNTQSLQGETPLMRAASAGFEDILRRLLACPLTEIAIEDEDGLTAVDHARRAGNSTAVALLRKKQDELLAQRQSALPIKTPERGRAWPHDTVFSTSMMGILRRRPY